MRFYGHCLTEWVEHGEPRASMLVWGINPSGETGYYQLWFSDEEIVLLAGPQREQEIAKKFFKAALYYLDLDEGEGLWYHWLCPACGEIATVIHPDKPPTCFHGAPVTWELVLQRTRISTNNRIRGYHELSSRSKFFDPRFPAYNYPLPE